MIEALFFAAGIVAGVDWKVLAPAAAAVWFPVPTAAALLVVLAAHRGRRLDPLATEVEAVEAVVGELRAGSSLRTALSSALAGMEGAEGVVRRLRVGEPLASAVADLERALPRTGRLIRVAIAAGGGAGRMLPVFEELVVHASAEASAAAELRTALAPVRASMTVLVGAPCLYLGWVTATGRLTRLLRLPGGAWVAGIGAALFSVGIAVMTAMARRRR